MAITLGPLGEDVTSIYPWLDVGSKEGGAPPGFEESIPDPILYPELSGYLPVPTNPNGSGSGNSWEDWSERTSLEGTPTMLPPYQQIIYDHNYSIEGPYSFNVPEGTPTQNTPDYVDVFINYPDVPIEDRLDSYMIFIRSTEVEFFSTVNGKDYYNATYYSHILFVRYFPPGDLPYDWVIGEGEPSNPCDLCELEVSYKISGEPGYIGSELCNGQTITYTLNYSGSDTIETCKAETKIFYISYAGSTLNNGIDFDGSSSITFTESGSKDFDIVIFDYAETTSGKIIINIEDLFGECPNYIEIFDIEDCQNESKTSCCNYMPKDFVNWSTIGYGVPDIEKPTGIRN